MANRPVQIDVVIPVYNKIRLLSEAVGSVVGAAEAYGRAQVWLVDNGSTDGSYELLDQFGGRARVLRLMSGTIAAVRNFGAKHGTAPIISFIDCDCLVPADYFSRLEAVLNETAGGITSGVGNIKCRIAGEFHMSIDTGQCRSARRAPT